jgi:phospholipase/carboxylesterase
MTPELDAHARAGRLTARPMSPAMVPHAGLHRLHLDGGRDGLVYVPAVREENGPRVLAVVLHGAGGNARQAIELLREPAERLNVVLLAPESRRSTWDLVLEGYGPDVAFIDRALTHVFAQFEIDPTRLAVSGFSDGASYALSLGLINGDLFSHVIAFSPGMMQVTDRRGSPRLFVSHGVYDTVLAIGSCSRHLVPLLQRGGYKVRYEEFGGGHEVPDEICREALEWLLGQPTT